MARQVLEKLFGGSLAAARELTTSSMEQDFNPRVPDAAGVRYFSLGFYIPEPVALHSVVPWLWAVHAIVADAGFPRNDGMVSVESARWGETLGTLAGDHYSETSPIPLVGGPDYLEVFARALDNLERRGE